MRRRARGRPRRRRRSKRRGGVGGSCRRGPARRSSRPGARRDAGGAPVRSDRSSERLCRIGLSLVGMVAAALGYLTPVEARYAGGHRCDRDPERAESASRRGHAGDVENLAPAGHERARSLTASPATVRSGAPEFPPIVAIAVRSGGELLVEMPDLQLRLEVHPVVVQRP